MSNEEIVKLLEALHAYLQGAKDCAGSGALHNVCERVMSTIEPIARELCGILKDE